MTSFIQQGLSILLITVALSNLTCAKRSNCVIRSDCDKCGPGEFKQITKYNIKVCCDTCSPLFNAGNLPGGRGYCTCRDPVVIERGITGDCWKGKQCDQCTNGYVGSINGVKVCCAHCEKSGLALSPTSCNCRHNGP